VSPDLYLWSKHVGEYVTRRVTLGTIREIWEFRERKPVRCALIPLKICFEAEILVDIDHKCAAASVETVTLGVLSIGAKSQEGVVRGHLKSWELLGPRC